MKFSFGGIVSYIKTHLRQIGMYFSFGLTTFKAFDYRQRYLNEINVNEVLHEVIDEKRDENESLIATYNNVLLNISMDNYQINDIKLPLWYQIYDKETKQFRMVKFNKTYEEIYGNNPNEYFANTNEYIAGDIGAEWELNNKKVLSSRKVEFFFERYVNKKGEVGIGRFAKWIIEKRDNIYLYGIQTEL